MRVLQIGSDRSKRGSLYPGSVGSARQLSYANEFGHLDIIGFSLKHDGAKEYSQEKLSIHPTNSISRLLYGLDAIRIARRLPRPDVVSVQDPFESGLVGVIIAKMLRVPLHVQVHTDFISLGYVQHSVLNKIRRLLAGFVLRRASRIRVVSERVKKEIITQYGFTKPIIVLPIFVDIDRMKNAVHHAGLEVRFAQFEKKILIVARLEPEKNVCLALRSFAATALHTACLIIVGEGSERPYLESLAKELQIEVRVFFEGEKPAFEYYPLADLILVTSRYEGYGIVIIEALAAGKPVLATDVGIAREAGAIVTSSEKFADALSQWFEDGPRIGELKNYPYKNFDEYVQAYCDDVAACIKK